MMKRKTHYVPRGFSRVGPKIRDVGGKALVEPQVIPPLHGHQVTKPLWTYKPYSASGIEGQDTGCREERDRTQGAERRGTGHSIL
jgi:hypothetical protein